MNKGGGMSLTGILTIIFVVLKLLNVISWSWIWVLSPLWISAGLVIGWLVILGIIAIIVSICVNRS